MKRHITLVLLLAAVLCLSGCAGRPELREETTMAEIDSSEPMLCLTIDGTAVDIQWENNAAVAELHTLAQNAITVNTSASMAALSRSAVCRRVFPAAMCR